MEGKALGSDKTTSPDEQNSFISESENNQQNLVLRMNLSSESDVSPEYKAQSFNPEPVELAFQLKQD